MPRPAKSAADHWRDGTVSQVGREKPVKRVASEFEAGRPKFPKHLSKDARREYKRICTFLSARRTLSEADYYSISLLSEIYARWIAAKESLGVDFIVSVTITDKKGNTSTIERENPLVTICGDCEARILSLSKALGLTPADRDRVKVLRIGLDEETVIPGSMAALNPELYVVKPQPKIDPAEMLADDEPEVQS